MTQAPVRSAGTRASQVVLRVVGWLFIGVGAFLLLFLAWLLWFTGFGTADVQQELLEEFDGFAEVDVDDQDPLDGSEDVSIDGVDTETRDLDYGSGVAVLEFERPGETTPPVNDEPVVVVKGVSETDLRRGPGHIPATALPGETGNFVVIGHRTTYGAPFYDIDQILPGDLVHLTDRGGNRFTYRVLEGDSEVGPGVRIIRPDGFWVTGPEPLGRSGKFLTLISCHPRFSSSQRIVVFAELVE